MAAEFLDMPDVHDYFFVPEEVVVKSEFDDEEEFVEGSSTGRQQRKFKSKSTGSRYACRTCGEICSQLREMKAHMEEHHSSAGEQGSSVQPLESQTNNGSNHICQFCTETFKDKSQLNDHYNAAHLDRFEFRCGICPRRFSATEELNDHHLSQHTQDFPICLQCQLRFTSTDSYETHYSRKHSAAASGNQQSRTPMKRKLVMEGAEFCPACDEVFTLPGQYAAHLPCAIAIANPNELRCPFCPRKLPTSARLDAHVDEFHTATPARFKCPQCQQEFPTQMQLNCHRKAHKPQPTSRSSMLCGKCFQEFSNSEDLLDHLRNDSDCAVLQ